MKDRRIYFYSHFSFEHWDYNNPLLQGIGGSETSHIEMASRLAKRGYEVISYAPVPWCMESKFRYNRDVKWINYEDATFSEDGLWIIYRYPQVLDYFCKPENRKNQEVWYVAQDVFYNEMNEGRAAKIDRYICLCQDHATYTKYRHPYLKDKISISSNGISVELIEDIEKQVPEDKKHNINRLIYSSSPDRGLEQLIPIFRKAKEYIPKLELHVYYGFDNWDKCIAQNPWIGKMKEAIVKGINTTDGIFWHGRIGQAELIGEWFKSKMWVYPINFTETSCISSMECQVCGVIPIVSPVWALRENIMHGILIEGDKDDPLTRCRFAGEVIRVHQSAELRHKLANHDTMMEARKRFNWENFVTQWENWMCK